jgi:oligoribonuclease NrnB/cAMP/cGMP phosphodiesterase (DHH superfamily)
MADVSLPIDQMIKLADKCSLTWIDHHKSIIDQAEANNFKPAGLRDIDYSACELCWKYFYPKKDMPKAVHWLGRYDIWKFQNIEGCEEFQYGMQSYPMNPDDKMWDKLFKDDSYCDEVVKEGKAILRYKTQTDSLVCKDFAFDVDFEGLKCVAINSAIKGSSQFKDKWKTGKYDAMFKFTLKPNKEWDVSLYSENKKDIDLSKIAKKYGGGGHFSASGFSCKKLPFIKN